jgi:hypothetical protein
MSKPFSTFTFEIRNIKCESENGKVGQKKYEFDRLKYRKRCGLVRNISVPFSSLHAGMQRPIYSTLQAPAEVPSRAARLGPASHRSSLAARPLGLLSTLNIRVPSRSNKDQRMSKVGTTNTGSCMG